MIRYHETPPARIPRHHVQGHRDATTRRHQPHEEEQESGSNRRTRLLSPPTFVRKARYRKRALDEESLPSLEISSEDSIGIASQYNGASSIEHLVLSPSMFVISPPSPSAAPDEDSLLSLSRHDIARVTLQPRVLFPGWNNKKFPPLRFSSSTSSRGDDEGGVDNSNAHALSVAAEELEDSSSPRKKNRH